MDIIFNEARDKNSVTKEGRGMHMKKEKRYDRSRRESVFIKVREIKRIIGSKLILIQTNVLYRQYIE